ncbi:MAG: hypothetical protein JWR15_3126 [Prosthecobacter sp.]|nr:hypothetical protein [Prosthecobacter sp.]
MQTFIPHTVKGLGIDADPANEPTYPIRRHALNETRSYNWKRPFQQQADGLEVLHSNERPNLSAVFGTSCPPAGLSGMLRRMAFRHSESSYAHWLPLMLADRLSMFGGLIDDVAHGHVPNVFKELGWKAEWRHNRGPLVRRIAVRTVVAAALVAGIWALANRR